MANFAPHAESQKHAKKKTSPGAEGGATGALEVLARFCLFLLFFQKKKKAAAPSSRNTFASVLVLSNVAYIHSSHYGKFKISFRFRAEEVIRDAMRAMAGSVRVRARYRARGVRDLGDKFLPGFLLLFSPRMRED